MRLQTSRNPILNPQNSKKKNQIHLTNLTTKSIKTHTNSSQESNPKPSNLRSKAKQKKSRAVPATHRVCAENLAANDRLAYAPYRLGDGTVHLGLLSLCSVAPFFELTKSTKTKPVAI